MKGYIKVAPMFPDSHHSQNIIAINVQHIVSVGKGAFGKSVITTTTGVIHVEELFDVILERIEKSNNN